MICEPMDHFSEMERERVLVIGAGTGIASLVETLRERYHDWSVSTCDTFLSGITELSRRPARAVLACVNPTMGQLGSAVAGLREAAGSRTKLLLCCPPEWEPVAREVRDCGADDYILLPTEGAELDAAVGRVGAPQPLRLTDAPAASMAELAQLAEMLATLNDDPMALLERAAGLIRLALSAAGATVVVQGAVGSAGEAVSAPVLHAPLSVGSRTTGHVAVSERTHGAYTPGDVEKLTHYATVIGHMLGAASQQRQWCRLAQTDECSGLPNRRFLHDRLDAILARAAREHFPVTVLLFDVDDFKKYNDEFGHDAGDEIIRMTGELFRKHSREHDVVARYGGDEFAVVFWDAEGPRVKGSKHPDSALAVLNRVTEALRTQQFPLSGAASAGRLTISGGLATYPWDASDRAGLIKSADNALLAAKRAGKNRIFLIGEQPA